MKALLLLVLLLLPVTAWAGQLAPQSEHEIARLIEFVSHSPCRFNRNGSWHAASEAAGHIDKKYHYALDKGQVHSAEDFIQYAASRSSLTGRPYKVQCKGKRAMNCADWLTAELHRLREQNQ